MPTRIITISEPTASSDTAFDAPRPNRWEVVGGSGFLSDRVPDAEPTTPRVLLPVDGDHDEDEVEVEFDDEFPLPLTPRAFAGTTATSRISTLIPTPTPTPTPIWTSTVAATPAAATPTSTPTPTSLSTSTSTPTSTPTSTSTSTSTSTPAPIETATPIALETPGWMSTATPETLTWTRIPTPIPIPIPTPTPTPTPLSGVTWELPEPSAPDLAVLPPDEPIGDQRDLRTERADSGDVPEVAAEDLVALEPSPAKTVPQPPVRVRTASPPTSPAVISRGRPPSQALRPSLVIVPPRVGSMPSQQGDASAARRKGRLWWEELFNDDYLRAAEKVTDDQIGREVTFIEESLGVERHGTLLDLACGTGRHATELARRGYEVVGLDLSLPMLARAGEDAQDRGAKLNFVQGDMREMAFEEQFDGVYCWSTSFGYFEEDKNAHVVERIGRSLKAGGRFLLDVVNRDFLIRHAPSLAWFEGDGCVCMDEMNVDFITSRLKVKRTLMLDDGRSREIDYSMRVYSLHELGRILHEHGFKVREVSGRVETPGVFFGEESPRTIILSEKS
jgi:SAM-dependent methyltransferase